MADPRTPGEFRSPDQELPERSQESGAPARYPALHEISPSPGPSKAPERATKTRFNRQEWIDWMTKHPAKAAKVLSKAAHVADPDSKHITKSMRFYPAGCTVRYNAVSLLEDAIPHIWKHVEHPDDE
ncbi:hypothetical protein AnigIFM50267_001767 [Aspergillus niger]|nr:hypothetical protein AnigIFM50267_001767 [Aspergillus niger]